MRCFELSLVVLIAIGASFCGDEPTSAGWPEGDEGLARDILRTSLAVDLTRMTAVATIRVAPSDTPFVSFEAARLDPTAVRSAGGDVEYRVEAGRLDARLGSGDGPVEVVVEYGFHVQELFEGLAANGATATWPTYCGNLFPCHSDPADGLEFDLALTGVPDGRTAVYPTTIPADAPAYQLAWSVADYVEDRLGRTTAGTSVYVWYQPGSEEDASDGTWWQVEVFDWYESNLGPYPFGDRVGSVEVDWGPDEYGGAEHHPFWHVSSTAMADPLIHAHEAAHGWYGDGVRLRCWEDFVLSEGTVTYLAARALSEVAGSQMESAIWDFYGEELEALVAEDDAVAWQETCGEVDPVASFNRVPYIKGAFFYRAVAEAVGVDVLDDVLGEFFTRYRGTAAGMQDMLELIEAETSFDPTALADDWLRSLGRPE